MVTVRGIMGNESELLWPGILVNTKLTVRAEDAVIVPSVGVQRSQTGNFVFVIKDGKAQVQPVTVSRTFQGNSVIDSGLEGGEDDRDRWPIAAVQRHARRAAHAQGRSLIDESVGTLHPQTGDDDADDGDDHRFRRVRLSAPAGLGASKGRFPNDLGDGDASRR